VLLQQQRSYWDGKLAGNNSQLRTTSPLILAIKTDFSLSRQRNATF